MLKGDLSTMSLASVLRDLADTGATGSLVLTHPDGDEAQIFMRSGLVCGLSASNRQSDLAAKLVSSGELAPEALAEALEAQRTDLAAWNLAELLVHLGYVEHEVVQEFVNEQMHEALWDLMRWNEGRWKFRKNAKTREDIVAITVVELLESLRDRGYEWESITEVVDSPNAVPTLSARGDGAPETTLDSDAWSMLCKIDGVRSVAELAADCGYTLFEAGQVLVTLVDAGLVDITDDTAYDDEDVYGASALAGALAGAGVKEAPAPAEADDALSRLTRLAAEVTNGVRAPAASATNPLQLDVMAAQQGAPANLTVPVKPRRSESFAASMDRVSDALADALGPAPEMDDGINELLEVRKRPARAKSSPGGDETDTERRKRLRAAAAAELADAAAAADSLRGDNELNNADLRTDSPLRLVDLEAERARVDAEQEARHAAEIAAREAAEQFAKAAAEQAARLAAQQAAAEQAAGQAAAEQLAIQQAAERAAAEQAAAEAAAAQLAAEQAAAAQAAAAQAAAEQAAAEQAAAEAAAAQLAAEQAAAAQAAAQAAAEQAAAEQAAAAQAAAEQAAAEQAAAEQAAAEAAAQLAAEQTAAAQAAAEAARLMQEQAELAAAQAAAEEAQRVAAEAVARSDEASAASLALAELHHTESAPVISVVPDPEPEPEPQPEPAYQPDPAPAPAAANGDGTDTAALLRELSSLGLEDEPNSLAAAAPPPRQRPQQVDPKKAKKKIGLFGL